MRQVVSIDPRKLRVGDIFGTTSFSVVGWGIRLMTWGGKKAFCLDEASHAGVIADRGAGLLYACEMQPTKVVTLYRDKVTKEYVSLNGMRADSSYEAIKGRSGLCLSELSGYVNTQMRPHFVYVGRHPAFNDKTRRDKVNDFMLDTHAKGVKYGFEDILRFLPGLSWVKDKPSTLICSEWTREILRVAEIKYPSKWDDDVSPKDLQEWPELEHITFSA